LHSAIKVDGKRAYKLARSGQEAVLKARQVTISEFEITNVDLPEVSFRIVCSKGTYIRSLAHDLGQELGVGAYLSELCRTRIGNFLLRDALTLDQVSK
jgi:tRNA pseudouridine55 synthase